MKCPRCQQEIPPSAKFCPECGANTAEIPRVIRGSTTDVQPVLTAVAKTAARLCDAKDAMIWQVEGDQLRLVAKHGPVQTTWVSGQLMPISRGWVSGRAVADRRTIHVRDLAVAVRKEFKEDVHRQRELGIRTLLATPLLVEGRPVGAITIRCTKVRPFTAKQIALLKTFADQAAIAIEKARLAQELEAQKRDLTEALEQQTATAEILQVISSSLTDVQPVFDAIVKSAVRLCGGLMSCVFRFDGELIHFVAHHNFSSEGLEAYQRAYPLPPTRDKLLGRALLKRRVVNVSDVLQQFRSQIGQRALGHRSVLAVPMLHEGTAIGVIATARAESGLFPDKQVALLKTFADQAVIAIENVRLFQELQAKNRDLTEALEQQTATSEILRVISSSPTDLQPVFDAIVRNAVALCKALFGAVFRFDGELLHLSAQHNFTPEVQELVNRVYPMPPNREQAVGRAILSRAVVHLEDALGDPEYLHQIAVSGGWRSMVAVPMFRKGTPVGVIWVARAQAGPFPANQIELLKTFADQAMIAIENVRLFQELQVRTRELTRSVEELKALGEVSQAVTSTFGP